MLPQTMSFGLFPRKGKWTGMNSGCGPHSKFRSTECFSIGPRKLVVTQVRSKDSQVKTQLVL